MADHPPLDDQAMADLMGLGFSDPARLVQAIVDGCSESPDTLGRIVAQARGHCPTRRSTTTTAIAATDAVRAHIRSHLRCIQAPNDVVHSTLSLPDDRMVDLTVRQGQDACILGGSLVSLDAVASLFPPNSTAEMVDRELAALAGLLLTQTGGPLTRRSLTRGGAILATPTLTATRRSVAIRPAAKRTKTDHDPARTRVEAIQSAWPFSQGIPRERDESLADYAKRLETLAVAAAANGDTDADRAVDELRGV